MKNIALKSILPALALSFSATVAHAQVTLANYGFTSASTASSVSVTGVTASNVTTPKTYFGFSSGIGNAYAFPTTVVNGAGGVAAYSTTAADAVATNRYFEFTVTPTAGNQLTLSSLSFNYGAIAASGAYPQAGAPFTPMFQVRSSVDGYAAGIGTTTALAYVAGQSDVTRLLTVSLSSLGGFSQLTTPTTFRLYGYFATGTPGYSDSLRIDNINLTGSVSAIPEPSAFAAGLGFAALGVAATRSRRRRQAAVV